MDPQLKRGVTEACVLALLSQGDSYGYRLTQDMQQLMRVSETTLYPVLRRLEEAGALSTYSKEHSGRLRRYYKITEKGTKQMQDFASQWEELGKVYQFIKRILQEEKNE
ncbi:MAG: PadR family transcriptional regulator [Christensenellales bacterium]|jgi:PadR family transcriptional regulator PadR